LCAVVLTAAIVATPFALSAFGVTPDYIGVDIARAVTGGSGDAVVAAGLAVQSQYPWAIIGGDARGWAQVTNEEMEEFGLDDESPYSPSISVEAMEKRIELAVNACKKCKDATDRLIVAALAQNGPGFDADDVADLPVNNGAINWDYVMTELGDNPSAWHAKLRQNVTGMNYDTRFMLKIFMQDLKVLMKEGYQLPDKHESANFDIIENLIKPRTPTYRSPAPSRIPSPI
jgi:hypothetical protein